MEIISVSTIPSSVMETEFGTATSTSRNPPHVDSPPIFHSWFRSTKLHKTLAICRVLLVWLPLLFAVCLMFVPIMERNVCTTSGCRRAASSILDRLDSSVDPCTDFYNFACGKYLKQTNILVGMDKIDEFRKVNVRVQLQLLLSLSGSERESDPTPFNLAKRLWKQCNTKSYRERISEILNYMRNQFDAWPISRGMRNEINCTETIKEFRKNGLDTDTILTVTVLPDLKNLSSPMIYIGQPNFENDLELLRMNSSDDFPYNRYVNKYYEYMVAVSSYGGGNRTEDKKHLKESLEFEIELAKISLLKEQLIDFSTAHNPFTILELQEEYPYIQWAKYINALLPTTMSVDENEVVIVATPSYFEKLGNLLKKTPSHIIFNHLTWRAIWSYLMLFGQGGTTECIQAVGRSLPVAVGAMYVRKYFDEHSKETASKMVMKIRDEFELILKQSNWIDERTRFNALRKLNEMLSFIGYPDMLMNNVKIEKFYEKLEIHGNDFLLSTLCIKKFDTDNIFRKPREPIDRHDQIVLMRPFVLNGFYSLIQNSLHLSATILQEPFFSHDRPWYMNFGAIGTIIGHEILHGFDVTGSQFDSKGNLFDWWEPKTKSNFSERIKCIQEQYGNYTEPMTGQKVWPSSLCPISRIYRMDHGIETDEHSPDRFRVIGPFSNRKEFDKDFQCPEGSPMNPMKKCDVW